VLKSEVKIVIKTDNKNAIKLDFGFLMLYICIVNNEVDEPKP